MTEIEPKKIFLRKIPVDVYKMIMEEKGRLTMKTKSNIGCEETIYRIIRASKKKDK